MRASKKGIKMNPEYRLVYNAPYSEWHPEDLEYFHPVLHPLQVDENNNVMIYKKWSRRSKSKPYENVRRLRNTNTR